MQAFFCLYDNALFGGDNFADIREAELVFGRIECAHVGFKPVVRQKRGGRVERGVAGGRNADGQERNGHEFPRRLFSIGRGGRGECRAIAA